MRYGKLGMKFLCYILLMTTQALPASAKVVKIATWNIEHLRESANTGFNPRTEKDYRRLGRYAKLLDADIVALQEIDNDAALAKVFDPGSYKFFVSTRRSSQRTAFAVKKDIPVNRLQDLDLDPREPDRLRHGVEIEVNVNGQSIHLLSVHLKSSCFEKPLNSNNRDCKRLASQVPILEKWIDERARNGTPFVVIGDFNRRFKNNDDFWMEIDDGEPAGLDLIRATEGFSSKCWGGRYPDYIDHIVYDSKVARWAVPGSFEQLVYEETERTRALSDHCPISIKLDVR